MGCIHTRLLNLIQAGNLISAEVVDKHMPPGKSKGYVISPALVLTFSCEHGLPGGNRYPLRKQYWKEFLPVIKEAKIHLKDSRIKNAGVYFKDIKVPQNDYYFWMLIERTELGREYYVHTSGLVAVHYKNGKERLLKPTMSSTQKKAIVRIGRKCCILKHLVAEVVFPYYKKGLPVICRDRNEMNCDYKNLIVTTKNTLGKHTGHLSGRAKPVKVYFNGQWQTCKSIRAAAKALRCSYQTIADVLKGVTKNSSIQGKVVAI